MFTYRYTFYSNLGEFQFGANQVPNWDNLKTKLSENTYYRGVFFEYTDTLEFCSSARKYIRDLVEREGMDAELQLKIEQGNESGHDSSFVRFGTTNLVAQFNETYEMGETSCNVSFAESGFKQKVINREDSNVDYQTYTSIDGETIETYESETLSTYMHDRGIELNSKGVIQNYETPVDIERISTDGRFENSIKLRYYPIPEPGVPYSAPIEVSFRSKDDDEINNTFYPDTQLDIFIPERMLIINDGDNILSYRGDVDWKFRFHVLDQFGSLDGQPNMSLVLEGYIFGLDYNFNNFGYKLVDIASVWEVGEVDGFTYWSTDIVYKGSINDFECAQNECISLFFNIYIEGERKDTFTCYIEGLESEGSRFNFNLARDEKFEATTIETVPIFDAVNRNLQIITGQQNSFKSNIFGKTTNGYAEDGELAYMTLANGKMIRGFPFEESKFNLNFKDIVKDIINQWNLVGFFSFDGENTFFNLERFEDVYDLNNSVEVDIISEVKVTLDSDWHFALLKYGIKNYEYEEVNGLDSFNGEFERGAPLKSTNKKLDIRLKKLRSDDVGIEITRRKSYPTTPTEDYRSDDDNFIIDSKLAPGYPYDLRATKSEDFEEINGIYSPDTAYNLRISAGRQLKEWYNILSPSLNYKPDNFIKFVKGAKNDNIQTKLIGEEKLLIENADIEISDLGRASILPYNIKFNCLLDFEKYNTIKKYPHKTIKFNMKDDGETFPVYVFVKELDYDINKGEATITGLRANR